MTHFFRLQVLTRSHCGLRKLPCDDKYFASPAAHIISAPMPRLTSTLGIFLPLSIACIHGCHICCLFVTYECVFAWGFVLTFQQCLIVIITIMRLEVFGPTFSFFGDGWVGECVCVGDGSSGWEGCGGERLGHTGMESQQGLHCHQVQRRRPFMCFVPHQIVQHNQLDGGPEELVQNNRPARQRGQFHLH